MKKSPHLSLVIPAYNEEQTIATTIDAITRFLAKRDYEYEIIVVDDGSFDGTAAVVEGFSVPDLVLIRHGKNRGKGAAVRTGMLAATGRYKLFLDADHQIPIEHLDEFLLRLERGYDVAIGSSPGTLSLHSLFKFRFVLGSMAKQLIRLVMGWDIQDSQRGFKLFRGKVADRIFTRQTINRWGFDIEILAIARRLGYSITEVPLQYRDATSSRVSLWSYITTFGELLVVRYNLWRGAYDDRSVSRGISIWPFLTVVAVAIAMPVFFHGKIFGDGDAISLFYPAAASFQTSHVGAPWNGSLLFGFPAAASFQFGFFNPLYRIVYSLFDFIVAYHVLIVLYFVFAGFLTFSFARAIGLSLSASVLSASVYVLGQFNIHWVSNIAVTTSTVMLPAVFLAVWGAFHKKIWYVVLGAIVLGLSLLSAHQQFVILALMSGGAYAAFLGFRSYQKSRMAHEVIRPYAQLALGVLLGILVGLPQLIYTWKFSSLSTRLAGLNYAKASIDAATPLDLIKYILPHFTFRYGISQEFLPYVGFLPLLLALIVVWKQFRRDWEVRFFSLLTGFSLLAAMKYSPLFWVMSKLPILEYFRGPARWTFVADFSMAMLAGFGLGYVHNHQEILQQGIRRWLKYFVYSFIIFIILANLVYGLWGQQLTSAVQNWFDANWYQNTTGLPLEYYHQVITTIAHRTFEIFSFKNVQLVVAVGSIFMSYGVVWFWTRRRKHISGLVVACSVLNLVAVGAVGLRFTNAEIIRRTPELVRSIKSRESDMHSFRVFSFMVGTGSSQRITAVHDDAAIDGLEYVVDGLGPNSNLYYGIPNADGYEPMATARSQQVLAALGSETSQSFPSLAHLHIPLAERLHIFTEQLRLLSMLNIKYIISAYELPATPGLSLVRTVLSTRFEQPLYLYENKTVLPRLYFAKAVRFLGSSDDEEDFRIITDTRNDFSRQSFLECASCTDTGTASVSDTLQVQEYRDGLVRVVTTTYAPRWLIFSESNLPGWRASIDGTVVPIRTANYLFQGIFLPPGEHNVELEYIGLFSLKKP